MSEFESKHKLFIGMGILVTAIIVGTAVAEVTQPPRVTRLPDRDPSNNNGVALYSEKVGDSTKIIAVVPPDSTVGDVANEVVEAFNFTAPLDPRLEIAGDLLQTGSFDPKPDDSGNYVVISGAGNTRVGLSDEILSNALSLAPTPTPLPTFTPEPTTDFRSTQSAMGTAIAQEAAENAGSNTPLELPGYVVPAAAAAAAVTVLVGAGLAIDNERRKRKRRRRQSVRNQTGNPIPPHRGPQFSPEPPYRPPDEVVTLIQGIDPAIPSSGPLIDVLGKRFDIKGSQAVAMAMTAIRESMEAHRRGQGGGHYYFESLADGSSPRVVYLPPGNTNS